MFRINIGLRVEGENALDDDTVEALVAALRAVVEAAELTPDTRNFARVSQSSNTRV